MEDGVDNADGQHARRRLSRKGCGSCVGIAGKFLHTSLRELLSPMIHYCGLNALILGVAPHYESLCKCLIDGKFWQ